MPAGNGRRVHRRDTVATYRARGLERSRQTTFERFLAAYHIARFQEDQAERIRWLEKFARVGDGSGDLSARTALGPLHAKLAEAHDAHGDREQAAKQRASPTRSRMRRSRIQGRSSTAPERTCKLVSC